MPKNWNRWNGSNDAFVCRKSIQLLFGAAQKTIRLPIQFLFGPIQFLFDPIQKPIQKRIQQHNPIFWAGNHFLDEFKNQSNFPNPIFYEAILFVLEFLDWKATHGLPPNKNWTRFWICHFKKLDWFFDLLKTRSYLILDWFLDVPTKKLDWFLDQFLD